MKLLLRGLDSIIIVIGCCLLLPGAAAAAAASPARERILRYVEEGQMFLIQDPDKVTVLLEKPNAPQTPGGNVKWFCTPTHGAPDHNGNGKQYYDNVVSHMLTYRPPKEVEDLQQQGSEMKGSWQPGGFTTAWANDHYNEYMVTYDKTRIGQFTELIRDDAEDDDDEDNNTTASSSSSWYSSALYLQPSTPTETNGMTAATVVEWTFNATSNPMLVAMADDLGTELTGTNCEAKYAAVWSALKNTTTTTSSSSGSRTTTLTMLIITTVSSLFFIVNHL